MKWVLILLFGIGGPSPFATTVKFQSQRACNDARVVIINATPTGEVRAFCFPDRVY